MTSPFASPSVAILSRRNLLAACLALALPSWPARAAELVDARGRHMAVGDLSRIVCVGGTITEILYALGAAGGIVAVDSTSEFPAEALRDKRNIGYMRMLSAEGVLSAGPSLLLVMEGSGPPEAIDALLASPVPLLFVDATPTPEAVLGRVRFLASVTDTVAAGDRLCRTIQSGFADLDAWRASHPGGQRVLFVLSMRNGQPVVAGAGTSADAIIGLAGGVNAATALKNYSPVSDEAVTTLRPDVVLTMDHAGMSFDDAALDGPAFRLTKAGQRHALIRMDGGLLLGFGPRTPVAALEMAKRLDALGSPT
ncbi:MAG TPA: ABC transporter substrate-binding protein [Aliidongia sp.]|nr:ABC transporter substrate-binding protein [Aliidongia sp.]